MSKDEQIKELDAKWDTYRRELIDWLRRRATEYPTKITSPFVFTKEKLAVMETLVDWLRSWGYE